MNNELITEKNWWTTYWRWILSIGAFVLVGLVLIVLGIKETNQKTENTIAFDTTKWKTKNGDAYPFRDKMVTFLVTTDTLRRLKKEEIITLLGEPDRIDKAYLFYRVVQERLLFFPLHTKTLVIKLSKDSTANSIMIHE